jgi:hypothetical protein
MFSHNFRQHLYARDIWYHGSRNLIKAVIIRPNMLQVQGKSKTVAHGELPPTRVHISRQSTGIDYSGPISLRLRSSSNIREVSPEKYTGLSHGHLRGNFYITCWGRCLSKFQILLRFIQLSFQPNIFVSSTFSNWLTTKPITLFWLN